MRIKIIIICGWLSLALNLSAGEFSLPEAVLASFDATWQATFSRELTANFEQSFIHPSSLTLLGRILGKEKFPEDPSTAAREYFNLASQLDRNLKQGVAMNKIGIKMKLTWTQYVLAGSDPEMEGNLKSEKIPGNLLQEKYKEKKDDQKIEKKKLTEKEKKDKEEKDKKDKEEKDKKDKEEKDKKDKEEKEKKDKEEKLKVE